MEERPIKDFPGYFITDDGKVISYKYHERRVMKTYFQKGGYENIKLCKDNVIYAKLIHRLVAEAFIPNPKNLPQVNHKNKIRDDNRVENLEWVTVRENLFDSYSTTGPTRNFKKCKLVIPSGEEFQFGNKREACLYASEHFGCSFTSLNKYGRAKGFEIIEV